MSTLATAVRQGEQHAATIPTIAAIAVIKLSASI